MWSFFVNLSAVCIFIAQHITCKFNDHHLHSQTNTKSWNVMCTCIVCCSDFTFNTTLPKSWTNHNSILSCKLLFYILFCNFFRTNKCDINLVIIVRSCVRKTFTNTLISILQVVFTYKSDINSLLCILSSLNKLFPRTKCWCLTYRLSSLS